MRSLKINQRCASNEKSIKSYFNDVSKIPSISPTEEIELVYQYHNNHDIQARDKLICSNLRFVISVAKQYQYKGIPLPDLINEGNIGLIRAIETFDPTKGFKFISYAVWWIRQSILLAIAHDSKNIRIPTNKLFKEISNLHKLIFQFEQKNLRKPSSDELSELSNLPESEITHLLQSMSKNVPLDTPLTNDEDSCTVIDTIKSDDYADNLINTESSNNKVYSILNLLTPRQREVTKMYFGIDYDEPLTMGEIADRFCITKERVRQLVNLSINKLRKKINLLND